MTTKHVRMKTDEKGIEEGRDVDGCWLQSNVNWQKNLISWQRTFKMALKGNHHKKMKVLESDVFRRKR